MSTTPAFAATHALSDLLSRIVPARPRSGPPPMLAELRRRRDEVLAIAAAHGATEVRVVGSVARGTASDASDVDLMVHLASEAGLREIGAIQAELAELLGCDVDVIPEFAPTAHPAPESPREASLRARLESDAVPL